MSGVVPPSWSSRRPVSNAIIAPHGLKRTPRDIRVALSTEQDARLGKIEACEVTSARVAVLSQRGAVSVRGGAGCSPCIRVRTFLCQVTASGCA